jgi:hypothetical protein
LNDALEQFGQQITPEHIKLTPDNFRKWLPYSIANYRYWPRKLNRCDQDKPVKEKMKADWVKSQVAGNKLEEKFKVATDDNLWEWCSISNEHRGNWASLPPQNNNWQHTEISLFFNEVVARHKYLYKNAYDFLKSS